MWWKSGVWGIGRDEVDWCWRRRYGVDVKGLIHGKTACEKASRGTAGEETPKKLSEPAISRRANVADQEEWFGHIPIPLVPRRGIGDTTTLARRSMVLSPGANLGPVTVPSGATFQPFCSLPQLVTASFRQKRHHNGWQNWCESCDLGPKNWSPLYWWTETVISHTFQSCQPLQLCQGIQEAPSRKLLRPFE